MGSAADGNHRELMKIVDELLTEQSDDQLTLMDVFGEQAEAITVTHSQIQERLGFDDIGIVDRVAHLLEEVGVKVEDDILTDEDRRTLEQWRKLAGIRED